MKKITTFEMEVSVANFLNWRTNIIVPNISWSFFNHECDLLRLSKSGYATEIEIKVSKSDLIKDNEKRHGHHHRKIKYLYFAIPNYLQDYIDHIPKHAGIIIVDSGKLIDLRYHTTHKCTILRPPTKQCDYIFSADERLRLLELMAMRIWGLKRKLSKSK